MGRFVCTDLPPGLTAIVARDPGTGLSAWESIELIANELAMAPSDTLSLPGGLRIAFTPGTFGTLFLTGLDITYAVQGEQEILIQGIPDGWQGAARLARSRTRDTLIESGLHVLSGRIDSAGYTRTSAKLNVVLAGKSSTRLLDVPILIRIDSTWDGFGKTLADGSDLRLTRPDGRKLPLAVASWNPANRSGELWTILDTLQAPADSIDLRLSWGIPVPTMPNTKPFSSSAGWVSAWPLGDTAATAFDWTGTFPGIANSLGSASGVVGLASTFDGRNSRIDISGSASGALDFAVGGPYTLSCWVRLTDFGTSRHIMGQGEGDYHLKFQKDWSIQNTWMAKEQRNSPKGGYYNLAPADTARWTHLAMVVQDSTIHLFVDGIPSDSSSKWDADASGKRAGLFRIGATMDTLGAYGQHFLGSIDEAWVQNVARSPDWLRIVANNQRIDAPRTKPVR